MKTRKPTVYDSQRQAAAATGISLEMIRDCKRQGCDAFRNGRIDGSRLKAWIRAHRPRTLSPTASPPAVPRATGAASDLSSLEETSARLWADYEQARRLNDPNHPQLLRQALDCSEQLRRVDRHVGVSRRTGQVMIPRADIESVLSRILGFWATDLRRQLLNELAPELTRCETLEQKFDLLETVAHHGLFNAVANVRTWTSNQPQWLLDCAANNLKDYFGKDYHSDALEARVSILAAFQNMTETHFRECLTFILARAGSATTDKP